MLATAPFAAIAFHELAQLRPHCPHPQLARGCRQRLIARVTIGCPKGSVYIDIAPVAQTVDRNYVISGLEDFAQFRFALT